MLVKSTRLLLVVAALGLLWQAGSLRSQAADACSSGTPFYGSGAIAFGVPPGNTIGGIYVHTVNGCSGPFTGFVSSGCLRIQLQGRSGVAFAPEGCPGLDRVEVVAVPLPPAPPAPASQGPALVTASSPPFVPPPASDTAALLALTQQTAAQVFAPAPSPSQPRTSAAAVAPASPAPLRPPSTGSGGIK